MAKKITTERASELLALVEEHIQGREWFEYEDFDNLIADEQMTYEELKWLRKKCTVIVEVVLKD